MTTCARRAATALLPLLLALAALPAAFAQDDAPTNCRDAQTQLP